MMLAQTMLLVPKTFPSSREAESSTPRVVIPPAKTETSSQRSRMVVGEVAGKRRVRSTEPVHCTQRMALAVQQNGEQGNPEEGQPDRPQPASPASGLRGGVLTGGEEHDGQDQTIRRAHQAQGFAEGGEREHHDGHAAEQQAEFGRAARPGEQRSKSGDRPPDRRADDGGSEDDQEQDQRPRVDRADAPEPHEGYPLKGRGHIPPTPQADPAKLGEQPELPGSKGQSAR